MFGYITPVKEELKLKDFETFKHYYCGLCHCIKKNFGNIPRLALNYDATFFAVLLHSICNESTDTINLNCIKHPLQKRTVIINSPCLDYVADLNISLLYYNLLDDVIDEGSVKSKILSNIFKHYTKKITNPNIISIMKLNLEKLHLLESTNALYSLDEVCHPFSHIIGEVLKEYPYKINNDSPITRDILYRFGYSFGKWIYLIDAFDDLKNDMEEELYNPINKVYNKSNKPYHEFILDVKEDMDFTLMSLAVICSDLLKELPINKNEQLIDNVINLGLIDKYMNIFSKI